MQATQRQLAAIMITDMVGYSALTQQDDALALQLLDEQRQICREQIQRFEGKEIKTMGDGFLVEFATPTAAVECAVEIQNMLKTRNELNDGLDILLRIGIHFDHLIHQGDDVFGNAVNIASRLEPLSDAGGICISRPVYEQVRSMDLSFVSLGRQPLKNIQEPLEIYKIMLPGVREQTNLMPIQSHIQSVAVLPFGNRDDNPENEYFSDGLTEDIITQLTRISGLKVISRTSTMQYKGSDKPLRAIGQELGVTTILEGSVRMVGNRVRINANLIDVGNGQQLWAETYDRRLNDIFEIQLEVAEKIATALKTQISVAEKQRMERTPTEDLEAYQLYLKGRFYWAKRTESALNTAAEYFRQALEKDPNYVEAHAGLAHVYSTLGDWVCLPPKQAYQQAEISAKRALELNPLSAKALTGLAHVRCHYEWDWQQAEEMFQQAIELNPGYGTAHHWYAECLAAMGRLDEALREIQLAREFDPFSLQINASYGLILYFMRRYNEAINQYQTTLEMNNRFFAVHLFLGLAYLKVGQMDAALLQIEQALILSDDSPLVMAWLGYGHAVAGQTTLAQEVLQQLDAMKTHRYVTPQAYALIHWGLKDSEKAFEHLNMSTDDRSLWLVYQLHVDPLFNDLRQDPRSRELLREMNLDTVQA